MSSCQFRLAPVDSLLVLPLPAVDELFVVVPEASLLPVNVVLPLPSDVDPDPVVLLAEAVPDDDELLVDPDSVPSDEPVFSDAVDPEPVAEAATLTVVIAADL